MRTSRFSGGNWAREGERLGDVLDSTFMVDLLRSDPDAKTRAKELDAGREAKLLSTPVLYEIASGLLYTRSRSEAAAFQRLSANYTIVPFDEPSAIKAAEIRAELMKLGKVKSHVDTMIAGIAAAGRHILVSRDEDFQVISGALGLQIESY